MKIGWSYLRGCAGRVLDALGRFRLTAMYMAIILTAAALFSVSLTISNRIARDMVRTEYREYNDIIFEQMESVMTRQIEDLARHCYMIMSDHTLVNFLEEESFSGRTEQMDDMKAAFERMRAIAYFILYNALKIYNTYWVYILPALFGGFYNVIIFNANYKAIPDALFESAKIDGASEYRIFFQIVMPLSKPVLSALGIFTAVGTWNDYAATLYYTRSSSLQTLSYYLLSITKSSKAAEELQKAMSVGVAANLGNVVNQASNFRTIELACMVLAALPLIIIYPFLQKFFEKGMMVGSVKG